MLATMRTIHFSLTVPLMLFSAFIVYRHLTEPGGELTGVPVPLTYAPAVLLLIAFPLSSFLFRNHLGKSRSTNQHLRSKIETFQTANLIRMSIFETAGFFAVIGAYLTGNIYLLVVVVIVLFMFYLLRPSPTQMVIDLELTPEERNIIEDSW